MKLAIIGFGFVGLGMYNVFKDAHEVRYHDKAKPSTIDMDGIKTWADAAFICVPTPNGVSGRADLSIVDGVCDSLEGFEGTIILKSTVPPGTTDALAEHYHLNMSFSPEYMGEGKQFVAPWKYPDPRDARSHPFVIAGGPHANAVLDLYSTVMSNDAAYLSCTNTEAELAKYMENSFLALKVAFMYEFAAICEAFGGDFKKVRELWLNDARMGRSHTQVLPGQFGFTGKCLPKDISAIVEASTAAGFDPELLRFTRNINADRTNNARVS
jgi:UDPglucose 6-dehydrogenase